jgi:polysaccharide export outer membrane protein
VLPTPRPLSLGLLVLIALPACSSPQVRPSGVDPRALPATLTAPLGGGEEASELARAIAINGVPSPTPELDELVSSVVDLTPTLGLEPLLSNSGAATPVLRLRRGDLVDLVVFGRDEFTRQSQVGADGCLQVFLLGSVPVVGLTPSAAAEVIREPLEARYLRRASVTLLLAERSVSRVNVLGQVRAPGSIELPTDRRLSAAALLTRVGGLADDADGSRLVFVRNDAEGQRNAYHFSLGELLAAHARGQEVWIQPEDQLVVPRLPDVFVYGQVDKPGPYPLREGSTVASILFRAGGLTEDADSRAISVMSGSAGLKSATLDSQIAPREVVFVPKRQRVYLVGAGLTKNGPLDLPRSGLTVVQAIAESGWFTASAKLDAVEILRYEGGKQVRIEVPVNEILDGERSEGDFRLRPGDLVFVPESIW